jgi:hypothetical protein
MEFIKKLNKSNFMQIIDKLPEKLRKKLKLTYKGSIVIIIMSLSFLLGKEYQIKYQNYIDNKTKEYNKDQINIAIDKNDNLIILHDNGKCEIYKDSIGYEIFDMYTKTIWVKNK